EICVRGVLRSRPLENGAPRTEAHRPDRPRGRRRRSVPERTNRGLSPWCGSGGNGRIYILMMRILALDKQIAALDLHWPRTLRPLRRSTEDGTGGHVELAAVAGACHCSAIQLPFRQGTPHVSTGVIEGIKSATSIGNVYLRSADIENMHRPG